MSWRITEAAVDDYLRLCRMDPRGSRTDRAVLVAELRAEVGRLEREKTGKRRSDGKLVYRGRQSRRYQYIVDQAYNELVQVRGESEVREQGHHPHTARGRRER